MSLVLSIQHTAFPDRLALVLSAQEEIIDDEDPVPPADTTADKSELESALQTAVAEDDLAGLLKAAGVAQVRNLGQLAFGEPNILSPTF